MKNYRDTRYMRSMTTSGAYKKINKKKNPNRLAMGVFSMVLSLIGFVILSVLFISFYPVPKNLDAHVELAVVPGAGITRTGVPSTALRLRLDKAADLYGEGKVEKIVISGEDDEVRIMRNYLLIHNIVQEDIVEDEASINTYDTVKHCADYMTAGGITNGVVFISQKYHIPRIALLSSRQKIQGAHFLSTDRKEVGFVTYQWSLLRESLALLRTFVFGH